MTALLTGRLKGCRNQRREVEVPAELQNFEPLLKVRNRIATQRGFDYAPFSIVVMVRKVRDTREMRGVAPPPQRSVPEFLIRVPHLPRDPVQPDL